MRDDGEHDHESSDIDREAILARRRALISRALAGLRTTGQVGAVAALAATGLTGCPIAQACLSIATGADDDCEMPTTETGDTETGAETGDTETGAETGC